MRDQLSSLFSYLFMSSAVVCLISVFAVLIILIRSVVADISHTETQMGYVFFYIFVITALLAPVFLYVSNKLEKYSGRMDGIS